MLRAGLTLAAILIGTGAQADPPGRDMGRYEEVLALRSMNNCLRAEEEAPDLTFEQAMAVYDYMYLHSEPTPRETEFDPIVRKQCYDFLPFEGQDQCEAIFELDRIENLRQLPRVFLDIGGHATPETIVWGNCGVGIAICTTAIFLDQNFALGPVLTSYGNCVDVSPHVENGMRDISISLTGRDNMVRFETYRFDGVAYQRLSSGTYGPYLPGD